MKIFISQPMRGRSDEEIKAEREKVKQLFLNDEIIDNFFEDYDPQEGCIPLKYLAKSIDLLADADLAVFCPGFMAARGCAIEYMCAKQYGIHILFLDGEGTLPLGIFRASGNAQNG